MNELAKSAKQPRGSHKCATCDAIVSANKKLCRKCELAALEAAAPKDAGIVEW